MTHDDAAAIRQALSNGQPDPAVVTVYQRANQSFPDGAKGRVTHVDDPSVGGEYIQAAFPVPGRPRDTDELPFAPSELLTAAPPPPGSPPPPAPAPGRPARKATTRTTPAKKTAAKRTPAKRTGRKTTARTTTGRTAPAKKAAAALPPAAVAGREITITIRHGADGWTVEAVRGRRRLTRKPLPVTPGAVVAAVKLLNVEPVGKGVQEIIDAGRSQAEQQAEDARRAYEEAASVLSLFDAPGAAR
jgi:hypothetical protein